MTTFGFMLVTVKVHVVYDFGDDEQPSSTARSEFALEVPEGSQEGVWDMYLCVYLDDTYKDCPVRAKDCPVRADGVKYLIVERSYISIVEQSETKH